MGGALALRAPVAVILDFGFHPHLVETFPQFGKGVVGSQVTHEGMRLCQVQDHVDFVKIPFTGDLLEHERVSRWRGRPS